MSYKCTRSDVRIMLHIISSAVAWQRTREDVDVICVMCFFGCNGFWNTGTERFDIFTIFKLFGYFQFHHWHPPPHPRPPNSLPFSKYICDVLSNSNLVYFRPRLRFVKCIEDPSHGENKRGTRFFFSEKVFCYIL